MDSKTPPSPAISICIPTWNGATTLDRCLRSALAQTREDLEVLVCDDASDDESVAIAEANGDPRVRVLENPERAGIIGNWNRCLRNARGDYLALVGQDDEIDPHWAERLAALLDKHDEAGLAFGRRRFAFDSDEARERVGQFFLRDYPAMLAPFYDSFDEVLSTAVFVREAMRHRFEVNLIGEPAFAMFRRDHPACAAGFDAGTTQLMDWEFYTRFAAAGPLAHCPEEIGTFHIRERATSVDNAKDLSRHDREYAHLLDVMPERFVAVLTSDDIATLREQRSMVLERETRR